MGESFHDKLMSGGGIGVKSASFDGAPGIVHKGYITKITEAPDIDPKTKLPKTWPSGDPKPPQIVVILQTEERDDAEDDGLRALYLSWKIREAVVDAVTASGGQFDVGGFLAVMFEHQDAPKSAGLSGVKHFKAAYQPPAAAAINVAAMQPPTAPAAPAAPVAAPVAAAPVAAPAPAPQAAPVAFDPASLLPG